MVVVIEKERKSESCAVALVIIRCARLSLSSSDHYLEDIFPLTQAMHIKPFLSCEYMHKDDVRIIYIALIYIFAPVFSIQLLLGLPAVYKLLTWF